MPLFSVIIPVYNTASYLEEAIQSVLHQTFDDWELLIIDDGSQDKSLEIAHKWGKISSKIRTYQHPGGANKGVSASRNLGLKHANGKWIAFLDADDVWYENKLSEVRKIISKHENLALIYSKADILDTEYSGQVKKEKYARGIPGLLEAPFLKTLNGISSATPSVVISKEVLFKSEGFNVTFKYSEDTLLYHKALLFGDLYFIDKPLLLVRYHDLSSKNTISEQTSIHARLDVYLELLHFKEAYRYRSAISYKSATIGMERVWKYFYKNPLKYSSVLFLAFKKIITARKMLFKHKILSFFLPFRILVQHITSLIILLKILQPLINF